MKKLQKLILASTLTLTSTACAVSKTSSKQEHNLPNLGMYVGKIDDVPSTYYEEFGNCRLSLHYENSSIDIRDDNCDNSLDYIHGIPRGSLNRFMTLAYDSILKEARSKLVKPENNIREVISYVK